MLFSGIRQLEDKHAKVEVFSKLCLSKQQLILVLVLQSAAIAALLPRYRKLNQFCLID